VSFLRFLHSLRFRISAVYDLFRSQQSFKTCCHGFCKTSGTLPIKPILKVLVTGASGYIGSHTAIDLLQHGHEVIGLDNYVNSSPRVFDRIEKISGKPCLSYQADLRDKDSLGRIFDAHPRLDAIMHFAALKSVDESVVHPDLYYENNVSGLINLIHFQKKHRVPRLIFSSSCTVYGNADQLPVTESTPWKQAESPYGLTKQLGEMILQDFTRHAGSMSCVSLRYFNPAGAHPGGHLGEAATKEVRNLIPLIMETGAGKRPFLSIYGNDYPTRDGTNVRDFIHIMDLARAHTLAMDYLGNLPAGTYEVFNLGTGRGVTILEAIEAFNRVRGEKLPVKWAGRRPGDVVAIYADYQKAKNLLGWQPAYTMEDIMAHAWAWEKNKSELIS